SRPASALRLASTSGRQRHHSVDTNTADQKPLLSARGQQRCPVSESAVADLCPLGAGPLLRGPAARWAGGCDVQLEAQVAVIAATSLPLPVDHNLDLGICELTGQRGRDGLTVWRQRRDGQLGGTEPGCGETGDERARVLSDGFPFEPVAT